MNRISRFRTARRGFTLIELLVVILILAILAALIVPKVISRGPQAKIAAATTDLATLKSALDAFRLDCDRYPTTDEGLAALTNPPQDVASKAKGAPYLSKDITVDPWQHPYVYKCPGDNGPDSYVVESLGKDGVEGGTGEDADIIDGSN